MRNYFVATCGWSVLGVLSLLGYAPLASGQDLTIASTHAGSFQLGQSNAYYVLRVTNTSSVPTSGLVSVMENAPAGLTITSMLGDGWTCIVNSCSRSDVLAGGASYPAIMAIASVAHSAGASLTNQATVSGGGDSRSANNTASDVTSVTASGYPLAWGMNHSGQATIPAGLAKVVSVAAGGLHSLALNGDGTVVAWGDNSSGLSTVPAGLSNVVAIAAGGVQNLALRSDGTVVAWGDDSNGATAVPAGLANVVAIAAGWSHSLALKSDGTVVAWGYNLDGEAYVPPDLSSVVAISAGFYHSLALRSDGTVEAWGANWTHATSVPPSLSSVVAIAAGEFHSLALRSNGTIAAWGYDSSGQIDAPAGLAAVVAIAAGDFHSLALRVDGTVSAWGDNSRGQTTVPTGLSSVIAIAAGSRHSLALLSTAATNVQVVIATSGLGDTVDLTIDGNSYTEQPLVLSWTPGSHHSIGTSSPIASGSTAQAVFTGWSDHGDITHTVAPTTATTFTASFKQQYLVTAVASPAAGGTLSPATGFYDFPGAIAITATPAPGYAFAGFSGALTGLQNPQTLTVGSLQTVTANFVPAIATDLTITSQHAGAFVQEQTNAVYLLRVRNLPGGLPSTGVVTVTENLPEGMILRSMSGLGWNCTGNTCTRPDSLKGGAAYPAIVVRATVAASAPASLTNQATVSGGGDSNVFNNWATDVTSVAANGYPVAWGKNDSGQSSVPAGLSNVVAVAGGAAHSLALKSDGTVVAWGDSTYGQANVPAGLSGVVAIAAGDVHSLALKSDGTVAAWGASSLGRTKVPAGLSNVVAIAAGNVHSLALKSDGTVVTWGQDENNQLAAPASLSSVIAIATNGDTALALRDDGTVVAWGNNNYGQADLPVGLAGIEAVAVGDLNCFALKTDGRLVSWGYDMGGRTFAPAGLSNVMAIASGQHHALALKGDGTVVAWGQNLYGESSVPASLSNVQTIAAGWLHSLAITARAELRHPGCCHLQPPPAQPHR